MTAVAPINTVEQQRKRRILTGEVAAIEQCTAQCVDDEECDESSSLECLSTLLTSMRLCGLYFRWPLFGKPPSNKEQTSTTKKQNTLEKVSVVYSIFLLVIMWIHAVRVWTMFYSQDKLLAVILLKAVMASWTVQCTVQQTVYFFACRTGKLDRVLQSIRLNTNERFRVRRLAVRITAVTWLFVLTYLAFFVYGTFFTGGSNDNWLAPSDPSLAVSNWLAPFGFYLYAYDKTTVRIVFTILSLPVLSAYCFPVAMTFAMSIIFSTKFCNVIHKLRRAVKSTNTSGGNGISDNDIEDIRRQHQTLCRLVKRANRFLKYYHVSALLGSLVMTIILLYIIIFCLWITGYNKVVIFTVTLFFIGALIVLSLTAGGGIIVNHYVSIRFIHRPTHSV